MGLSLISKIYRNKQIKILVNHPRLKNTQVYNHVCDWLYNEPPPHNTIIFPEFRGFCLCFEDSKGSFDERYTKENLIKLLNKGGNDKKFSIDGPLPEFFIDPRFKEILFVSHEYFELNPNNYRDKEKRLGVKKRREINIKKLATYLIDHPPEAKEILGAI